MDATIYQIIFGELGDINCSLMDAFQDTFLENISLSLLSTDGKVEVFLPSFFFFLAKLFLDEKNERLFFFFPLQVFIAMPQPTRLEPAGRGAALGGS